MEEAGRVLSGVGPRVVMITGGHLADDERSPDLLVADGRLTWLDGLRLSVNSGDPQAANPTFGAVIERYLREELPERLEPRFRPINAQSAPLTLSIMIQKAPKWHLFRRCMEPILRDGFARDCLLQRRVRCELGPQRNRGSRRSLS